MNLAGWIVTFLLFQPASVSEARKLMLAGQFPEAEKILRTALTQSDKPDTRFLLGFCLYLQNNFEETLRVLPADSRDSRTVLYRGLAEEGMGRSEAALADYRRALATDPRNPETLLVLARLLRKQGHPDEAERHVDEALRLTPAAREALYEKGQCLFDRGEFAAAAAAGEKALTAPGPAPGEREIRFLLTRAWLKAGDPSRAAQHRAVFESLPQSLVR